MFFCKVRVQLSGKERPPREQPFDHVTNEEYYIFTFTRPIAIKLDREVVSDEMILSTKSHNPLITRAHQVIRQIKNITSPFSRDLSYMSRTDQLIQFVLPNDISTLWR